MRNVLIVDDHPIYAQGLQHALNQMNLNLQATSTHTAGGAFEQLSQSKWDLVLLDISLPDKNGLEVLKQIRQTSPEVPVLVLSIHAEEQYAVRALKAGASGYLTKDSCSEKLKSAIQKIFEGGKVMGQKVADKLAHRSAMNSDEPHESLSDREMQVLCMIASGKAVKDISAELSLSVKTVSTYRTRILAKLGKTNNAELIQFALLNQLVPLLIEATSAVTK